MKPHFFSVASVFRDETRYLREWVEYYRLVGADHLYLLCNDQLPEYDRVLEILRPYVDSGFVDLTRVPDLAGLPPIDFWQAMAEQAFASACHETEWLAMLDLDEFLFPVVDADVASGIRRLDSPGLGGIAVNWCVFGSSGHTVPPTLQTKAFRHRAHNGYKFNYSIKTIVRCDAAFGPISGNHYYSYRRGWECRDTSGAATVGAKLAIPQFDQFVVNHYRLRSLVDYAYKCCRPRLGLRTRAMSTPEIVASFVKHDHNQVRDDRLWLRYGTDLMALVHGPPNTPLPERSPSPALASRADALPPVDYS